MTLVLLGIRDFHGASHLTASVALIVTCPSVRQTLSQSLLGCCRVVLSTLRAEAGLGPRLEVGLGWSWTEAGLGFEIHRSTFGAEVRLAHLIYGQVLD